MKKTIFHISGMDCASEEQMIRMALDGDPAVQSLSFDIPNRELVVFHIGSPETVAGKLQHLKLGAALRETVEVQEDVHEAERCSSERGLLWMVLLINLGGFILEIITGLVSGSMGLVADSLDMLADALVYALALLVVGGSLVAKRRIATAAGYFQVLLAALGFAEVVRRFLGHDIAPAFETMIIVSLIALAANAMALWLLQRAKSGEPHMKASLIFTSNDVVINLGVIVAAVLVHFTSSNKPDLIVGSIVFAIVIRGALRILRLGRPA